MQTCTNFTIYQNHLEGCLPQITITHPRVLDAICLEWSSRICIFHRFAGDAEAAVQGQHFENQYNILFS